MDQLKRALLAKNRYALSLCWGLLLSAILFPLFTLEAQQASDCITFENPYTDASGDIEEWARTNSVFSEFADTHGVTFRNVTVNYVQGSSINVNGPWNDWVNTDPFLQFPQIAKVGGATNPANNANIEIDAFFVGPARYANVSGGNSVMPRLAPPGLGQCWGDSKAVFEADQWDAINEEPGQDGFLDTLADADTPVYDHSKGAPYAGEPPTDFHDLECTFLTSKIIDYSPNTDPPPPFPSGNIVYGDNYGLLITYTDETVCHELSGLILDTETRVDTNGNLSGYECWRVTAWDSNKNLMAEVRVYPFDSPDGLEYWDANLYGPNSPNFGNAATGWQHWPPGPNNLAEIYDHDGDGDPDLGTTPGIDSLSAYEPFSGTFASPQYQYLTGDGGVRRFSISVDPTGDPIRYVLIEPKESVGFGPGNGIGLGFDVFCPCSATEDVCTSSNEIVTCETNSPGTDYTLTFDLTNNSNNNVSQLVIPGQIGNSTITPNVINLPTVLQPGGVATGIELNISGGNAGDNLCIPVGLISTDSSPPFQCCSTEVCVELPSCCLAIIDENIFLEPTTGETTYAFAIENLPNEAPAIADHLFVNVIAPPGAQISPQWFPLNSLIDNSSQALPSSVISGVSPGDQICLQMTLHNDTLSECCGITHYTTVPSPLTAPIPTFIRGDANSDGSFDLSDVITGLGYLFQSQNSTCLSALDSNDDETIDIADAIFSLDALFGGGPSPWPPHQNCGTDETPGSLGCEYFPACEISGNGPQGG